MNVSVLCDNVRVVISLVVSDRNFVTPVDLSKQGDRFLKMSN